MRFLFPPKLSVQIPNTKLHCKPLSSFRDETAIQTNTTSYLYIHFIYFVQRTHRKQSTLLLPNNKENLPIKISVTTAACEKV